MGAVVALTYLVSRAPGALTRIEAFRVSELRLEGARFLSLKEAADVVAVPSNASLWDDLEIWTERLSAHPLVRKARVRRRFPSTLVLEVAEREPVALVATPTLEPMDETGRILPIDPARHQLDLPLVGRQGGPGRGSLSLEERRVLGSEISRLAQTSPEFGSRLSEVILDGQGGLRVQVWDSPLSLFMRPGLPDQRIMKGLEVLEDARVRFDGRMVEALDLRFEDQVVVRLRRPAGS
jgi:cell division septal protein FtsQ